MALDDARVKALAEVLIAEVESWPGTVGERTDALSFAALSFDPRVRDIGAALIEKLRGLGYCEADLAGIAERALIEYLERTEIVLTDAGKAAADAAPTLEAVIDDAIERKDWSAVRRLMPAIEELTDERRSALLARIARDWAAPVETARG